MKSYKEFLTEKNKQQKVIISVNNNFLDNLVVSSLDEARHTKNFGKIEVHKDSPHFKGGEYHGHVDLPGGKQVSYTISGKRLHPNKFPKQIPSNIKNAIAQVLGVDSDLLESYEIFDEIEGANVILLELKQPRANKLLNLLKNT